MVDTVKTVRPSGGDYTSLSAWEAGQQKVIAAGDSEQAECYSMADTAAVTIDGWTTASDAYIRIYTPASERHDGKWSTAKYRLESASGPILQIVEEFVRIEGLQIYNTSTTAQFGHGVAVAATGPYDIRIDSCLVRAPGSIAANNDGIQAGTGSAGAKLVVANSAVYGWYSAGNFDSCIRVANAFVTLYLYNSTIANGNYGVRCSGGAVIAKNCYAGSTDYGDYLAEGSGTITLTTCASEDTTGSAGLQNIAYSTTSGARFTSLTVGAEDFHIGASSSLRDVGTDLSADANYAFSHDIDGQPRAAPWDIGADEIVTAVAGAVAATLAAVTAAVSGIVGVITGTVSTGLANVTLSAAGSVEVRGTVSSTLANITATVSGIVGVITGSVSAAVAPVTAAISGLVSTVGTVNTTLANITAAISGAVGSITGTVNATLQGVYGVVEGAVGAAQNVGLWFVALRRRRR